MANTLSAQLEPLSLFKKSIKFVLTLLFATAVFGIYLLFTPQGAKTALMILDFTDYKIQYSVLEGTLVTGLNFEDISLNTEHMKASADTLSMAWKIQELFLAEKTLKFIKASNVKIQYDKPTLKQEASSFLKEALQFDNKSWVASRFTVEDFHDKTLSANDVVTPTILAQINTSPSELSLAKIKNTLDTVFLKHFKIENIEIQNAHIQWNNIQHNIKTLAIKNAHQNLVNVEEIIYQGDWGEAEAFLKNGAKAEWSLNIPEYKLTTKGKVYLPHYQIEDKLNKLEFSLSSKSNTFFTYPLENMQLDFKGSLHQHEASLKSLYKKTPLIFKVEGKMQEKGWHGKIKNFEISHRRWNELGRGNGNIGVTWGPNHVNAVLDLKLNNTLPIYINATSTTKKPYLLSGKIQSQVQDIRLLAPVLPDVKNLRGKLNANLDLAGTLFSPLFTGVLELKEAKIKATQFSSNASIQKIQFKLNENNVNISGNGTWGSGEFHINGTGVFKNKASLLSIHFHGTQLLLSDTPEYYIVANPDLKLTLENGLARIQGKIFVPQAQIKSLKSPSTTVSTDVVVNQHKKNTTKPLTQRHAFTNLATHIEIILSDKITYQGHGLTAGVIGNLTFNQQPGQGPTGTGKFILKNGKYHGYGKTFDIEYGQILFSGGPLFDPVLDIHAQRKITPALSLVSNKISQPIIAGLKFSGHIKAPKLEFYSHPSMNDADIMSYLIVGRPQQELNTAQAEILFEAVSQLTRMMGNSRRDVNFNIAEQLKLDQFGFSKRPNQIPTVGANPLENTVFVLGKQLSDRLYLHYSVGILDSASNFGMRYILGKNLSVEASTGSQGTSADVLLSLEGH